MAIQDIISTLIPTFAFDYVAVFSQDFTQVFRSARPIKAVVKEQAKVMQHPVESGATITDHRIIEPIEIQLSMILSASDYLNTYQQIRQLYQNATLLVVQTKSGIYTNQLISSLPHEEDPNLFDTITIALNLKQVIFVTAQYGVVPKNQSNTNTAATGQKQSSIPPVRQQTAALDLFKGAGLFK